MPASTLDLLSGDLPLPIGGGVAVGVPPTDVDVLVDRVPFWLAVDANSPYQRETAQFQRQQVDQQPEAGEQSLAGWWTRSQMSFHYGAGLDYLDTDARPEAVDRLRFHTSYNVDCWTPGTLKRLNDTSVMRAGTDQLVWVKSIDTGLVVATPTKIEKWNGTTWTALNPGTAAAIRAFCTDGVNYYVAVIDGVYSGPLSGATNGTKLYTLPGTDLPMCLGWVKQRLILGCGAALYSLDTAGPALPTPKYTNPVAAWQWTQFCDGPDGILACGYAGLNSGVYKFGVTDVAGTPTLGTGISLITMPSGERITSATYYLGALLVLGTNRGIRVCPFQTYYGTMTMGPLTVGAASIAASVTSIEGFDRYVFAGATLNGTPTLIRIDLSSPLDSNGHYAWAPDLPTTAAPTSIAFRQDGTKWLGVPGVGVVQELLTPAPGVAYLETARIRMGSVEDKLWSYLTVRGSYSTTSPVTSSVSSDGITWVPVATHAVNAERVNVPAGRSEWIALRLAPEAGAVVSSYQLQALPGGRRQRLVQFPVTLTDYQLTRSGIEVGYRGWAVERLAMIEAIEEGGGEITVSAPALFPTAITGVIEKLTYVQTADPGDRGGGTGGVLQVLLRTT